MQVPDPSVRQLVHLLAALIHPAFVPELVLRALSDRRDARLPRPLVRRFAVERDLDLAIQPVVQHLPVIVARLHGLAVDREQVIADAHRHPILVGRAAFIDVGDLVAAGARIRLEIETEISGGHAGAAAAPRRRGRRAGVRRVQLADHLVDDVEEFLAVADVRHERLVLRAHRVPVLAVHLRIVEAILHRPPRVAEHLGPFGGAVDLHAHVEADATARRFAPGARGRRGRAARRTGAASLPARGHRDGVHAAALAEKDRTAVAREREVPHPAAASRGRGGLFFIRIATRAAREHARQPAAVLLNRVQRRLRPSRPGLRRHEGDRAAVGRDRVRGDAKRHPSDLTRAALEASPIDTDRARRRGGGGLTASTRLIRAVGTLGGIIRVAIFALERDRVHLRSGARSGAASATAAFAGADEVQLQSVRREARRGIVRRVERDLVLLAAARRDQVDVVRTRLIRPGVRDPLPVWRPRRRADVAVA